jgi:hypothetical protein
MAQDLEWRSHYSNPAVRLTRGRLGRKEQEHRSGHSKGGSCRTRPAEQNYRSARKKSKAEIFFAIEHGESRP